MRVHAASVQFCHRSGDKDGNLATIARFTAEVAADGV